MAEQLKMVIRTLQELDIKATHDNLNHLLACLELLGQIVRELEAPKEGEADGVGN